MEVETKYLLDKIKVLEESVRVLQNEVKQLKPKDWGTYKAGFSIPAPSWHIQASNIGV